MTRSRTAVAALVAALAIVAASCSGTSGANPATTSVPSSDVAPRSEGLVVVSTRPEYVTGGDVLVRLDPARAPSGTPTFTANGTDVEARTIESQGIPHYLVSGLPEGKVHLEARVDDRTVSVDVVDHPVAGPLFSGPHLPLPVCTTEQNGLGPPTDDDCSAPSRVQWLYGTTAGTLQPLPSPSARPADLATVERDGAQVPFLVRRETGVLNRSVYSFDVLDPDPASDPAAGAAGAWNHRLVYRFGGGCGTSYSQGTAMTSTDDRELLAAGYVVATATFNTFQVQCNDVLSAETAMVVKEHVIETFGPPDFTIGEGASGGAIQQHLILQNYPGLLDGAVAILPFPDAISISPGVADCGLLLNYYGTPDGKELTSAQQQAVNGHGSLGTCPFWKAAFLSGVDPFTGCDPGIPHDLLYDPATNPKGIRCTLPDANVNSLGRDPATGFARRPLDNVGVQYGLAALADGTITPKQFLDLNAGIGGYDIDGHITPQREVADVASLRAAYGKGRVVEGGGDLKVVPLIDINIYTDPQGDIHDRFRSFSLRDRLGGSPNQVIWTRPGDGGGIGSVVGNITTGGGKGPEGVDAVDRWLTAAAADHAPGSRAAKIARNRPPDAADNCITPDGQRLAGDGIYDGDNACTRAYPLHGDPRTVAGAPRRNDVLKCRLTPVDPAAYPDFTPAQLDRLRTIFPDGVCDWSEPGVGKVDLQGTWLTY